MQTVYIQQALSWMFSSAVSSIDHVGVGEPRSHARRAHLRMPDHQDIRVVTLERKYRILETLPFGHAGSRPLDVDHIRGQTLTRQLKGSKGPRGRLKEHVHLSSTAQCGNLFDWATSDFRKPSARSKSVSIFSADRSSMEIRCKTFLPSPWGQRPSS